MNMEDSCVELTDMPEEILLFILNKLTNIELLYSLIGINIRLDKILNDSIFTEHLTLTRRSWNNVIRSLDDSMRKILKRVEQCAKHCASCATQCIAATSAAGINTKTHQTYQDLIHQCKIIADLIPKLVQSIRSSMIKPDSSVYQYNLLNTCEDFFHPAMYLTDLATTVVTIIHDQSQALHLNNSSKQLTQALNDLKICLNRVKKLLRKFSNNNLSVFRHKKYLIQFH